MDIPEYPFPASSSGLTSLRPYPTPPPSSQPAIIIRVTRNFQNLLSLARQFIVQSTNFLKIISFHFPHQAALRYYN